MLEILQNMIIRSGIATESQNGPIHRLDTCLTNTGWTVKDAMFWPRMPWHHILDSGKYHLNAHDANELCTQKMYTYCVVRQ